MFNIKETDKGTKFTVALNKKLGQDPVLQVVEKKVTKTNSKIIFARIEHTKLPILSPYVCFQEN